MPSSSPEAAQHGGQGPMTPSLLAEDRIINTQDLSWTQISSLDLEMKDISFYVIDNPDSRGGKSCGSLKLDPISRERKKKQLDPFFNKKKSRNSF